MPTSSSRRSSPSHLLQPVLAPHAAVVSLHAMHRCRQARLYEEEERSFFDSWKGAFVVQAVAEPEVK